MKRALPLLLVVAACGGPSTEPPDAMPEPDSMPEPDAATTPAQIDVTWHLFDGDATADCPPGATAAAINALRVGDTTPFVDIYDCSALAGSAAELPPADYTVWGDLTDDSGATLYAQSESASITLSAGETATADFHIDVANAFLDVSWALHTAGGAATTCGAVTQNGTSILSTNTTTSDGYDSIYACTDGEAPNFVTTDPLPVGSYVTVLSVLDLDDAAIGSSDEIQFTFDHANEFVDLGVVVITMN